MNSSCLSKVNVRADNLIKVGLSWALKETKKVVRDSGEDYKKEAGDMCVGHEYKRKDAHARFMMLEYIMINGRN